MSQPGLFTSCNIKRGILLTWLGKMMLKLLVASAGLACPHHCVCIVGQAWLWHYLWLTLYLRVTNSYYPIIVQLQQPSRLAACVWRQIMFLDKCSMQAEAQMVQDWRVHCLKFTHRYHVTEYRHVIICIRASLDQEISRGMMRHVWTGSLTFISIIM